MIKRKSNRSEHVAGEFPPLSRHNQKSFVGIELNGNSVHLRSNSFGADPQPVIDTDLFGRKRAFDAFSQPKAPHSQGAYFGL
ncbi:MAG: hypothetical protein ACQEUH_15265 [Pseudomonadota bacterium]